MGNPMSYEDIAQKFLDHLAGQGQKLVRRDNKWGFANAPIALKPDILERILRTYLLEAGIPQSIDVVANVLMILDVMLDPNPLGKIEKPPKTAKKK